MVTRCKKRTNHPRTSSEQLRKWFAMTRDKKKAHRLGRDDAPQKGLCIGYLGGADTKTRLGKSCRGRLIKFSNATGQYHSSSESHPSSHFV